ncbi:MAG: energy transducer TonB [Nitrospirae bacterium]|nr:energy transducer TonB [Nitrospirota bacterium]
MAIKRFLLISVALHAIILIGIYFLPEQKTRKAREFFTQLVTPEQAKSPEILPSPPAKPIPVPPDARPLPVVPKSLKPLPPVTKIPPKTSPSQDKPMVPGQGKDDGKPLPEGASPKPGKSEAHGDEPPEESSSKPGFLKSSSQASKREASNREKLFDINARGDAARKGDGAKKKNDQITFESQDYRYAGYMRKLKEKIESIWEYPPEASKKGLYGDLKISFTIRKDGRLGALELIRTSGYKMLDDAALKAIRDGEPYWPIPDSWGMDSYTINGHFFYTMFGYGIR